MKSEDLISRLAADASPVKRLSHPIWRAAMWFCVSTAYAVVLLVGTGWQKNLSTQFSDSRLLWGFSAAMLTAMMAAAAAFCSTCPGRPLWERLAPFPFLLFWVASTIEGCRQDLALKGSLPVDAGLQLALPGKLLLVSAAPAVLILLMVRRGAPIAPYLTTGLSMLAATAIGAAAMLLAQPHLSNITLLIWQILPVIIFSGIASLFGPRLLYWSTISDLREQGH